MKRSEVIKILTDKFKGGEIPEPAMWANDILDILERRVKMKPPFLNDQVYHKCGIYDICDCHHIWEEHNE